MEVRLINANDIVKVAERAYDAWNLAMATQDTNRGVNKVFKMQELCKAVEAVAKDVPTIDPEDLLLVKELRGQLAKITAERDAAISDLHSVRVGLCDFCKYADGNICKCDEPCNLNDNWEWRGLRL